MSNRRVRRRTYDLRTVSTGRLGTECMRRRDWKRLSSTEIDTLLNRCRLVHHRAAWVARDVTYTLRCTLSQQRVTRFESRRIVLIDWRTEKLVEPRPGFRLQSQPGPFGISFLCSVPNRQTSARYVRLYHAVGTRRVFQEVIRHFFILLYFRDRKENVTTFFHRFLQRVSGRFNRLRIGKVRYIVAFSTTAVIIRSIRSHVQNVRRPCLHEQSSENVKIINRRKPHSRYDNSRVWCEHFISATTANRPWERDGRIK